MSVDEQAGFLARISLLRKSWPYCIYQEGILKPSELLVALFYCISQSFEESQPLSKFLKVGGSKRLTNGGRGAQLSTPPLKFNVPHDIIKFFPKSQERIFEVSAPLYESGYTLREIESKTGFAKSSIRQALTASGLTLRVGNRKPTTKAKRAIQASSPVQRYGYARLEGQLVKDPKEYRNVLQILKLWQSGKSLTAIANHLNDRKAPPRRGLRWHHETVHQIVKHETQNKEK